MCHVERGVPGRLTSSNSIGPENVWSDRRPSADIAAAGLDNGFTDSAVLPLDDSVCTGVVS